MAIVRLVYEVELGIKPDPLPVLEYTSSLSKAIVIKASGNELEAAFKPRRRGPPKPVAITPPLYYETGEPVASLASSVHKPRVDEFKPVLLESGKYWMQLSLPSTLIPYAPKPGRRVRLSYHGAVVDATIKRVHAVATAPPPIILHSIEAGDVTIETLTPYLPKDPYIHSKYSPFHLAPDATLAIPAYIHSKILGQARSLAKTLTMLRRCLILPHTGYCRLRKVWYLKRSREVKLKPLPALHGRITYKLNTYDCTPDEIYATLQIAETAKVTGIGKSRANGFGILKTPQPK